jgi:hypothetical protein
LGIQYDGIIHGQPSLAMLLCTHEMDVAIGSGAIVPMMVVVIKVAPPIEGEQAVISDTFNRLLCHASYFFVKCEDLRVYL